MGEYDRLLKEMPTGLVRAILRVLSDHAGRKNAIGRQELLKDLARLGFKANERQVREQIRALRRMEHLICSAPGENGGYYLANNRVEFDDFMDREYRAKIIDMNQTATAMVKAANKQFGNGFQERLF